MPNKKISHFNNIYEDVWLWVVTQGYKFNIYFLICAFFSLWIFFWHYFFMCVYRVLLSVPLFLISFTWSNLPPLFRMWVFCGLFHLHRNSNKFTNHTKILIFLSLYQKICPFRFSTGYSTILWVALSAIFRWCNFIKILYMQ